MSRLSDDHAFWERMERRERRARAARRWGIRLVFAALTLLWIVDVADRLTQRGAARCTGGSQVRVSLTYARAIFCFARQSLASMWRPRHCRRPKTCT